MTATRPRRGLWLDRRTVGPALLVLGLALVMSVALPAIDRATPYRHPIVEGDVVQVADGLTLAPAPGWSLASGALRGRTRSSVGPTATTELVDGGVEVLVQAAPFTGTAPALLRRVERIDADLDRLRGRAVARSRRYPVTTRQGRVGVGQDFTGVGRQGSVVAFVFGSGEGVEVAVSGPAGAIARRRDAVVAMIRSLRAVP
jgi:hypothetical protein